MKDKHDEGCELGDNWKTCDACIGQFIQTATKEELKMSGIKVRAAELMNQSPYWAEGYAEGKKSTSHPVQYIQERWNALVVFGNLSYFDFKSWEQGYRESNNYDPHS